MEEQITQIMCQFNHPEITSHHDLLLSKFSLPRHEAETTPCELVIAPRTERERNKVLWNDSGINAYRDLVEPQLRQVRQTWEDPSSKYSTAVLLEASNFVLNLAAITSNPSVPMSRNKETKTSTTPRIIKAAKRKLKKKHKNVCKNPTSNAIKQFELAKKVYRQSVRTARLELSVKCDKMLDSILSDNPRKLYSYLRNIKKAKTSRIEKLVVGEKVYSGNMVGDGFYDSMSSLKYCDKSALLADPALSEHQS